jgi:Leucine-rich repeat (LRR) protein
MMRGDHLEKLSSNGVHDAGPVSEGSACLQLPKGEPDQMAEKRATLPFREVEELIFSYRNLVKIDNLMGFDSLTKLKLDCNRISKIDNLSHLVCCLELWQNKTCFTASHTLHDTCCQ